MGPGMGMGMQMRPEQRQMMILAPRMIQSMEILQLPIMALQERIQEELQANPVLELRENSAEGGEDGADDLTDIVQDDGPAAAANPEKELVIDDKKTEEDFDRLIAINED